MRGYIFTKNERRMLLSWLKGRKPRDIRMLTYRIRGANSRIQNDHRLLNKALVKIKHDPERIIRVKRKRT